MEISSHRLPHDLSLKGVSLAGIHTCLQIPELGICFDVAQGLPFALNSKKFFITHGHMDHAAGIPYVISQKNLSGHAPGEFYMPARLLPEVSEIMNIWSRIENHHYQFQFFPVEVGSEQLISEHYLVRAFEAVHSVPCVSYGLFRRRKKLLSTFMNLSGEDIRKQKAAGVDVDQITEELVFVFSGDTMIDFLDRQPGLLQSNVLALEITYWDEARPVSHAHQWQHTHLDELLERLDLIQSEKIILLHPSIRYPKEFLQKTLKRRLKKSDQERVVLF